MSSNTFGKLFRFTTWGESHGPAIGCVIDGCPPNIQLNEKDIQKFLDKRKPGTSKFVTQRKEDDKVTILSGVFNGKTTGTPISLIIWNKDQRSKDYGDIKNKFRPGHADLTYFLKYQNRDYRGGGRSSARETACRVAAGAIARKVIKHLTKKDILIHGAVVQVGEIAINPRNFDWKNTNKNSFFCPDKKIIPIWEEYLSAIRKKGLSVGAKIFVEAKNVPAGIGEPIYGKLDSDLASAMISINAVKGVEIGLGNDSVDITGAENSDELRVNKNKKIIFSSNNSGGMLGGISSGQDIQLSVAIKPTSSILKSQKTINDKFKNTTISTRGRHDPCVGIRAVPIVEAMTACVLADHLMRNKAQCG
jgi:chorismate synthase